MKFKTITEIFEKLYSDSKFRKSVVEQNNKLSIGKSKTNLFIEFIDSEGELHKCMYTPKSDLDCPMEIAEAITHAALKL